MHEIKGFSVQLLILSTLVGVAGYWVCLQIPEQLSLVRFFSLLAFVSIVTFTVHAYLVKQTTSSERPGQMVTSFMLATTVKLFLYLGALSSYVIVRKFVLKVEESYTSMFTTFVLLYMAYSILEVTAIFRFLKSQK